jgi:radical SAM superfamily enzyme YgiQ (UPF0313 family)
VRISFKIGAFDMKIVLMGMNATYGHTNLAIRTIRNACASTSRYKDRLNISCIEFTIHDHLPDMLSELKKLRADVYGFSCYIWNIKSILVLTEMLYQIMPDSKIVLGGPEVSYNQGELLSNFPYIDYVFVGPGEYSFRDWVDAQISNVQNGFFEREWIPPDRPVKLNELDFPYGNEPPDSLNKQYYYESSRGCPFSCSYCLSSISGPVDELPEERVMNEMKRFIEWGVRQVKVVDRTFNIKDLRARRIWQTLIDYSLKNPHKTNFHFEIAGDLLSEETISVLSEAPEGLFRFEIGVQSTCPDTLKRIARKSDIEKLTHSIQQIIAQTSIKIHLDLIVGLPGEGTSEIIQSYNNVMMLRPHVLQVGFLKLLKGTPLRCDASRYGIRYSFEPPYEILCSDSLSFEEIFQWKRIARLTETFYNSGKYTAAIRFLLLQNQTNNYEIINELVSYYIDKDLFSCDLSRKNQNEALLYFGEKYLKNRHSHEPIVLKKMIQQFKDLMKFDYYRHDRFGRIEGIDFHFSPHHPDIPNDLEDPLWVYVSDKKKCTRPRIEKYTVDPILFLNKEIITPDTTYILYDMSCDKPRIIARMRKNRLHDRRL